MTDERKNEFIPNSFQTPNIYIDRVLPLLEPSEFVVLMFAVRHILGWTDNVQYQAKLSLTAFEKGTRGQPGCGLSRVAIADALSRLEAFGLLMPIGKPDAKGQTWRLVFGDKRVAWTELEARKIAQLEANQKRTKTARKRRQEKRSGISDTPEVVSVTNQPSGISDIPTGGLSDIPEVVSGTDSLKHTSETHIETQEESFATSPNGEPRKEQSKPTVPSIPEKPKRTRKRKPNTVPAEIMNPMKDAIAASFDWSWDEMTASEKGQIQKAAQQLCKVNFPAADIPKLYDFCERKFDHFGPMALATNVSNYRRNGGVKHGIHTERQSSFNPDGTVKRPYTTPREPLPHLRSQTG